MSNIARPLASASCAPSNALRRIGVWGWFVVLATLLAIFGPHPAVAQATGAEVDRATSGAPATGTPGKPAADHAASSGVKTAGAPADRSQSDSPTDSAVSPVIASPNCVPTVMLVGDEARDPSAGELPDLAAVERAFAQVISHVTPSVVGLRVKRRYIAPAGLNGADANGDAFFEQTVIVNGSGSVIDADGLILTNEHVVQSAKEIEVYFSDGRMVAGEVVGSDPRSDLAIVRAERRGLRPIRWCDYSDVRRGQWTIAIGNPFGLGNDGQLCVSVGVISNLNRRLPGLGEQDDRLYADMLQTTASINPGNSGGPLFNARGELLGIVTAMHTRAGSDDGVGFAIAMNPAKRLLVDRLASGRPIEYGYAGLVVRSPEPAERRAAEIDDPIGAAIDMIEPGGPADDAGLLEGDLIVALNGRSVAGASDLVERIGALPVGSAANVELFRGQSRRSVAIKIERRQFSRVAWLRGGAVLWRGLRLANLDAESRERLEVDSFARGVVIVDVIPTSPAGRARIEPGDIIERVEQLPVRDVDGFERATRDRQGPVIVWLRKGGQRLIQP